MTEYKHILLQPTSPCNSFVSSTSMTVSLGSSKPRNSLFVENTALLPCISHACTLFRCSKKKTVIYLYELPVYAYMWQYRSQWRLFSTQTIYMLSSAFVSVCVILREPHEDKRWPHMHSCIYQQVFIKDIGLQCSHRYVHKINAETQTSTHKASTNRGQTFSSSKRIITLIRPCGNCFLFRAENSLYLFRHAIAISSIPFHG